MKKILLLVTLIAVVAVSTAWHKYYFSVSQIDYNDKTQSLEVISRIFYDDLEKTLQMRYDPDIKVDNTYPKQKLDQYISRYFDQKFLVSINGEQKQLDYLGHKDENDYVVCYIEIKDVTTIQSLKIENTLLMDAFTEQKNVVHVNIQPVEKSFLLTAENDKAVLNF